jgi:hypothetical protein
MKLFLLNEPDRRAVNNLSGFHATIMWSAPFVGIQIGCGNTFYWPKLR